MMSIFLAAAGATLIGFFCVRTSGIPFLMLTLAFSQLIFSIALKWREMTGGTDGLANPAAPLCGPVDATPAGSL